MTTTVQGAGALDTIASLAELFAWRVGQTPHGEAYRQYDVASGQWRSHSWGAIGEQVQTLRRALHALALPAGARIAILLPNCIDAVCMDQASLALGMVP